jgi:hypothetical protein
MNVAQIGMRCAMLLALSAGCDGGGSAATSGSAATGAATSSAPGFAYLPISATWQKRPLKLASALAFSRGGSALNVTFSSHPIACADLRRGVQKHPAETSFALTFSPVLQRDGTEAWSVSRARFGQVTRQGKLAPVMLSTFKPTETINAKLDLSLLFPPHELTLNGSLEIKGCGLMPVTDQARVLRQNDLSLTLAGQPIPMNGATLVTKREHRLLRISSEPHGCKSAAGSDVVVTVVLPLDSEVPIGVRVDGYRLPRTLGVKVKPGALNVERITEGAAGGGAATPADQGRWSIAGDLEVAGYALHTEGSVQAQICADAPTK